MLLEKGAKAIISAKLSLLDCINVLLAFSEGLLNRDLLFYDKVKYIYESLTSLVKAFVYEVSL